MVKGGEVGKRVSREWYQEKIEGKWAFVGRGMGNKGICFGWARGMRCKKGRTRRERREGEVSCGTRR